MAFINSLVMTPIGVRISRRIMQRRLGVIFDDDQVEEVKRTVEPSSKIGPASIAAAAVVVALINQQVPTLVVFALGSAAGALSPNTKPTPDQEHSIDATTQPPRPSSKSPLTTRCLVDNAGLILPATLAQLSRPAPTG